MKTFTEYKAVQNFYGDQIAKRSKLPYMKHIDEALLVLKWRNASDVILRAFCLHPLFQSDDAFVQNWNSDLSKFDSRALILAIEYRNVANSYLSHDIISNSAQIKLSPIQDVNEMLVADKIQNRKDFELHFRGSHLRTASLQKYFANWFNRLKIDESYYTQIKNRFIEINKINANSFELNTEMENILTYQKL